MPVMEEYSEPEIRRGHSKKIHSFFPDSITLINLSYKALFSGKGIFSCMTAGFAVY